MQSSAGGQAASLRPGNLGNLETRRAAGEGS